MGKKCGVVAIKDEVLVEAWPGDDDNEICSIRGHSNVRHNVLVGNLRLYSPKRITCEGSIRADAPVVRFLSDNPSDTNTYWTASINGLASGDTYTFNPCVLEAVDGVVGTEKIYTVVRVDWYSPRESQIIALDMDVSTG